MRVTANESRSLASGTRRAPRGSPAVFEMVERQKPRPRSGGAAMTGDQLRAWRDKHGMSRKTLAELFEVAVYTLYRWENGEHQPAGGCTLDFALEALETRMSLGIDLDLARHIEDRTVPDNVPER